MLGCQNSYGAVYDSVTVNVSTAPPNTLAGGSHDANYNASCQVLGWAADADTKSQDIKIRIYSDGTYIKEATASQYRSDLETAGVCTGGTCGFAESISGLITSGVAHSITVKAIDAQTGQEASLGATPKNITCPVPTTGNVVVTSNLPTVWKLSGPSGTQNQTASSTGATYSATQTGIYTIAGIPSISGYKAPVVSPASSQTLSTGETRTFTITYEAEAGASGGTLSCAPSNQAAGPGDAVSFSATGGSGTTFSWTAAGGAPSSQSGTDPTFATAYSGSGLKTVMVTRGTEQASCTVSVSTTGNNLPDGTHDTNDNASCLVMGWTADPDDRSTDLSVRIYSDGSLVKTVTANKYRSDLTGVCTGGTCSFSESLTGLITAGVSHAVTVKSVDGQTGQESTLVSSPRSITCPSAASDYDILSSNNIEIDLRRGTKSSPTTITVDPLNGFASAVPLTARSSSPELSSAVYTLSDPSLAAAEYSRGSALTVTVGAGTPTGSYPITVEGVADGKIRTANITLRIIGKIQDFREI
jgi:plastocyanin